ncbi:MAG: NADH-quinone oxidoreductase subunit L [Nitrospiraceae bacterium]|nr:NADH-quinone oxidoreductase subunit L [Nitrospiraceae bacterium]
MLEFLWLIPALPFAGSLVLAFAGRRLSRGGIAAFGVGSVGLSCITAFAVAAGFIGQAPPGHFYVQRLWAWLSVGGFTPEISLYLDALSLVMMLVVTFVGFLIHLYSSEFMIEEEGYGRFFAYMNLFVGSMLTLVLADNLLLLYLGWEGVGLCSYLLIGFWYKDPANGLAARKAFVVTRVGDTAMSIGLFLLFTNLGTLQIQELMRLATERWAVGSGLAVAAAALLLGGALGKSAQLPLQTWLPDAMAGPSPVSALIHAATMVTAGVYLIARTHVIFSLAPVVQEAVAVIGALTLLLAGFSALTQTDIKRVLAYSTISQIGYMFLALGVGAWSAAIFHFMTHAFFKALLFLGAGIVINALHDEHNMFKMGGLRSQVPVTFWTFLVGASSLSALPFVTAGFYSKDLILFETWASPAGSRWLWAAGLLGAFLTSLYTFRMVFVTFYGDAKMQVSRKPGAIMTVPVVILAVLSVLAGFLELPSSLGNVRIITSFLGSALPSETVSPGAAGAGTALMIVASAVSLAGIFAAYLLFFKKNLAADRLAGFVPGRMLHRLWFSGWGFDWLYDLLFVRPFFWFARSNKDDFSDLVYLGMIWLTGRFNNMLSVSQNGKVRFYAAGIAFGAVVVIAIAVFL